MALWQLLSGGFVQPVDHYDDEMSLRPGDDGFSTDAVAKYAPTVKCDGWNYIGTPDANVATDANASSVEEV